MVAIVAGNGLGLLNTSLNTVGRAGVLGHSALGQGSTRAIINVVNGNRMVATVGAQRLAGQTKFDFAYTADERSVGQRGHALCRPERRLADRHRPGEPWRWCAVVRHRRRQWHRRRAKRPVGEHRGWQGPRDPGRGAQHPERQHLRFLRADGDRRQRPADRHSAATARRRQPQRAGEAIGRKRRSWSPSVSPRTI